jgi:hypothetical protein
MMTRHHATRVTWAALRALTATALASGCTLVTDLSHLEQEPGEVEVVCNFESADPRDLILELLGFSPHVGQLTEIRVVSTTEPPVMRALARLMPLQHHQVRVEMPGAIPSGSHRLDFYSDFNDSGDYSPPESGIFVDHSWRIAPCVPVTEFTHDFNFDVLEDPTLIGGTATIDLRGMPVSDAQFELRIIEEDSQSTVGLVRLPGIEETDFIVEVPGIVDPGFSYRVAFYIDSNGNGAYDPPPLDEAWEITGITGGVDERFDYDSATVTDIGF